MVNLPPLWEHQRIAIAKAETVNDLGLLCGLGTGKSRMIVEILRNKYNKYKKIYRTLIVGPKAVVPNWEREILKFSRIPITKICVLDGSLKKRIEYYNNFGDDSIYVTNYEAFASEAFAAAVLANPPNFLVCDEVHKCKSNSSKRTKTLIKLSEQMEKLSVHHRYTLSGTPVLQNTLDLFPQFMILNQGKTFGKNFFAFRANYFRDKNAYMARTKHFPNWQPIAGSEEKLKALMEPHVVTAKKEDCIDLPPLLKTTVPVELSPEQKKAYDAMKRDFITFIDEKGPAVATLALTKTLRMQQIVSGHLTLEDGTIHSFEDNPRLDALEELLEDITPSEKVIVWATWQHDHAQIRKLLAKLKIPFAEVTGAIKDKQAELDKFEKDPLCRVMLATQSAGGTGTNMIAASVMIFYSKNFTLEHDLQSEARNFRGGSNVHAKITRIDLVAEKTIDEIINKALSEKSDLASRIVDIRNLLAAQNI